MYCIWRYRAKRETVIEVMWELLEVLWKCKWETEKYPARQSVYKCSSSSKTKEKVFSVEFTEVQSTSFIQ